MTNSNIMRGQDALDSLNASDQEDAPKNEFTRLKSGSTFTVKVPGFHVISAYVYGNFENPKINSFVAENDSKRTAKGFPVENLTPFDKAFKYYKDKSEDWQDEMSAKANVYKADQKFTFGFYDLDGEDDKGKPVTTPIAVEFTRNQAQVIRDAIKKNEKYLDKFAFELSKKGTGRSTVVSLTLIPMLDELTDKQRDNFDNLPEEFDSGKLEGLHYVMSDEEQIETLQNTGFDVSLIGLEVPEKRESVGIGSGEDGEITDDDLPF